MTTTDAAERGECSYWPCKNEVVAQVPVGPVWLKICQTHRDLLELQDKLREAESRTAAVAQLGNLAADWVYWQGEYDHWLEQFSARIGYRYQEHVPALRGRHAAKANREHEAAIDRLEVIEQHRHRIWPMLRQAVRDAGYVFEQGPLPEYETAIGRTAPR